jgi:hypothetical protein
VIRAKEAAWVAVGGGTQYAGDVAMYRHCCAPAGFWWVALLHPRAGAAQAFFGPAYAALGVRAVVDDFGALVRVPS